MSRSVDVVIIGSGNVAEAFSRAVSGTEGLYLRQIFARNSERGQMLARECNTKWCGEAEELAEAYIDALLSIVQQYHQLIEERKKWMAE